MMRQPIRADEAYVAIDDSGFVEGACFTQSADSDQWIADMEAEGFSVEIRNRSEARRILFTYIERPRAIFIA